MTTFPDVPMLFRRFEMDAGSDGAARANFQLLVTDLVMVQFPDATTVEGAGGRDWGIDTIAGELSGGDVRLWQSKFIMMWQDKSPRSQIYTSYKSAKTKAVENGYALKYWTLVVPCILAPKELQWFSTWKQKRLAEDNVAVDLWDGPRLRHLLQQIDAESIARRYFAHLFPAPVVPTKAKRPRVAYLDDPTTYDGALFVRQLHEAGRMETDVASAQFYATDALFRDFANKGDDDAVTAILELEMDVREIWENRFNQQVPFATGTGLIPEMIDEVIGKAGECADPDGVELSRAHKKGTVHRIVEKRWAGWVKHWRGIAADHDQPSVAYDIAVIHPQPVHVVPEPVTLCPKAGVDDTGAEPVTSGSVETA
ncbi:hypothetical protein [Prescottella equi]|uniref:hypothetical protein n=1 Tax=Rhodococcus hoagii TaxID=43767 RepID=UPI001C864596|nr:hypothetical protein [Prescottella equi]